MTDWNDAIRLEHKIAEIITQQEINGWQFDVDKANKHVAFLEEECEKLYDDIRPILVPEVIKNKATVKNIYKADGSHCKRVEDYWEDSLPMVGASYSPVEFVEPELSSRPKLIRQLMRRGWRPTSFTDKGNPRLTEESLLSLEGEEGKMIAKWYIYRHRQSQILGWLEHLDERGRISAQANPCGTNTGRMRHSVVVNVPKAKKHVVFGKEMRELFIAAPGCKLVGHDAAGLELRMLAHYLNDPEYTEAVTDGDIHSFNQELAGLPTRDHAKTFIYAFIYGAGDKKLGQIVGGTKRDGKEIRARFLSRNKALGNLIKRVKSAAKRGYLIGLDGRKLWIRNEYSAPNLLIQGGGAIVMKVSMAYLDKWLRDVDLYQRHARKVGDFHDEAQEEVTNDKDIIELYSGLAVESIRKAGEHFELRCPLDAESKVGDTWAETH